MKKFFLFLCLLIMLTACSVQNKAELGEANIQLTYVFLTDTVSKPSIEETVIVPTTAFTQTSTNTPTLVPTSTPMPTTTVVPTKVVNFDGVRIIGVDNYPSYTSIIIEFPAITKLYQVKINNSAYNCQIPEETVDRLFCSGQGVRTDEYVEVKFFEDETFNNELAALNLYVPKPYATPLPVGDPSTWCPERGTNISCETEHRMEYGEECWVQTCTDACGYYYSYHTCQLPPNNNFLPP